MASDRVNELYRGEIFEPSTQQICRDRIHWMCGQVSGRRVLDIGCSQGIASLILGREGHSVVGVDTDPAVIEYAQREVEQLPEIARRNVQFLLVQPGELPFEDASFDTVLLGEILEHQTRPDILLAHATRLLKPGGKAIITTPFGVHPAPDHVRTFYLRSFLDTVEPHLATLHLHVLEKYICFVGERVADPAQRPAPVAERIDLLGVSEKAFERAERTYLERMERFRSQHRDAQKELERMREAAKLAAAERSELTSRVQAAEQWRIGAVRLVSALNASLRSHGPASEKSHLLDRADQVLKRIAENKQSAHELDVMAELLVGLVHERNRGFQEQRSRGEQAAQRAARDIADLKSAHEKALQAHAAQFTRQHETALRRIEAERLECASRAAREIEGLRLQIEALQSARAADRRTLERAHQEAVAEIQKQHQAATADVQRRIGDERRERQELNKAHVRLKHQAERDAKAREVLQKTVDNLRIRINRQAELISFFKTESELKQQEVRYKLGDAFVRAATSPADFIFLPGRMAMLLYEGLRRRHDRRRLALPAPGTVSIGGKNGAPAARQAEAIVVEAAPPAVRHVTAAEAAPAAPHAAGDSVPGAGDATVGEAISPAAAPGASAGAAAGGNGAASTARSERAKPLKWNFDAILVPNRPPKLPVRAAVIMDEFTIECFKGECHLIPVAPENWKERLTKERPDFLFVESAWRGNAGAWQSQLTRAQFVQDSPLLALVKWCREQGIPTVFWNKEDPPNYEHFIFAASQFDYIFTTDADCVPRYREQVKHDHVWALPFAAQPLIHNPIGCNQERYGNLCFAGTYYAKRHEERRGDIDVLLRPALKRGLTIFDRMHEYTQSDYYRFPPEYHDCIFGSLPYPQMVDAYKKFKVFLNVNSVKDSPTMFSRRVFELLACGTPVVSTYAAGIEQLLGRECVALAETEAEAEQWMDLLLQNPEFADRMLVRSQRRIFSEHTYEHRLRFILEKIGIAAPAPNRAVSVVTCTNRPTFIDNVVANYQRQAWPEKELVLVLNSDSFDLDAVRRRLEDVPNARVFQVPEEKSLGECLNRAIDEARYDYWTKLDDDNFHAEHFLTDLMLAFTYADAQLVGKCSYYAHLEGPRCLALRFPNHENRYVNFLSGSAMIVKREVLREVRFPEKSVGEDTKFLKDCVERGFRMYSTDRFNYVVRRAASVHEHTWKIEDTEYLRKCRVVAYTDDYRPHVTV